MLVIFTYYYVNFFYKNIWGIVILFFTNLIYIIKVKFKSFISLTYFSSKNRWSNYNKSHLIIGKRNFSTFNVNYSNKKSPRKTLSSPEAKSYDNLYLGRGKPEFEPVWVKDNNKERSPFGASWAKDEKCRLPYPSNYTCNYTIILDPFNNRKKIQEICKGNRVVYIWVYKPTGICLVGSSSNSVERVISYFEKKYLFLDTRRGGWTV